MIPAVRQRPARCPRAIDVPVMASDTGPGPRLAASAASIMAKWIHFTNNRNHQKRFVEMVRAFVVAKDRSFRHCNPSDIIDMFTAFKVAGQNIVNRLPLRIAYIVSGLGMA